MGFYKKIKYYLVHTLGFTNKEAQTLIENGDIEIDGRVILNNENLDSQSQIKVRGVVSREKQQFVYLKFYKPAGYQSSLNKNVPNNLSGFFTGYSGLAIAGRLDMMSEGLLLLSDDGKWVERMCNPKFEKAKEYLVVLDKEPDAEFTVKFESGVKIGNIITKTCTCKIVGPCTINVIITEGKNRQIRRMCHKSGYRVLVLKRVRMAEICVEGLSKGSFKILVKQI